MGDAGNGIGPVLVQFGFAGTLALPKMALQRFGHLLKIVSMQAGDFANATRARPAWARPMGRLLAILVMLAGCSATGPRTSTLTADQAGALAQRLANEKARVLYNCQPFRNGPPARFDQGHWTWHDLKAQGPGDAEATVEFKADGTEPKVKVIWLDSRPRLMSLPLW